MGQPKPDVPVLKSGSEVAVELAAWPDLNLGAEEPSSEEPTGEEPWRIEAER